MLVVRLGALGDIVHTVPAVAAIASAAPGVSIDWLVERRHRAVLDLFALPATPVEIETGGSWLAMRSVVGRLRSARYDVALDFQGLLKSAVLARLSGARRVVGFIRGALREPMAGMLYTERVDPGAAAHVIGKNLALARAVGVRRDGRDSAAFGLRRRCRAGGVARRSEPGCGLAQQAVGARSASVNSPRRFVRSTASRPS